MIGEQLRLKRIQLEIGLRQLARSIAMSASTLSDIELGKSDPTWSQVERILNGLGITAFELFLPEDYDAMLIDLSKRPSYFWDVRACWWFHYHNQFVVQRYG